MLPAFFAQFAAGCYVITAISAIQASGWSYMRLMAAVCFGLTALSAAFLIREAHLPEDLLRRAALAGQVWAMLFAIGWLFVNAKERPRISRVQGRVAAVAGV